MKPKMRLFLLVALSLVSGEAWGLVVRIDSIENGTILGAGVVALDASFSEEVRYAVVNWDNQGNITLSLNKTALNTTYVNMALLKEAVSHWSFDECSGRVVYDHNEGNNGALLGGPPPQWIKSRRGCALNFTGGYVRVNHSSSLNFQDEATFAVWVKLPSTGHGIQEIFGKTNGSFNGFDAAVIPRWQGGDARKLVFFSWRTPSFPYYYHRRFSSDPLMVRETDVDVFDGEWHNLVFRYYHDPVYGTVSDLWVDGGEWWGYVPNREFERVYNISDPEKWYWIHRDSKGNAAWPWALEAIDVSGNPYRAFEDGLVIYDGVLDTDEVWLAIPDAEYKPYVRENISYTQRFRVRVEGMDAPNSGVRIRFAWLNWTGSDYEFIGTAPKSPWLNGTTDWTVIEYSATAPPDADRGDIILVIRGRGKAWVDWGNWFPTYQEDRVMNNNHAPLFFGAHERGGKWSFMGSIDEVGIWRRALLPGEVRSLYGIPMDGLHEVRVYGVTSAGVVNSSGVSFWVDTRGIYLGVDNTVLPDGRVLREPTRESRVALGVLPSYGKVGVRVYNWTTGYKRWKEWSGVNTSIGVKHVLGGFPAHAGVVVKRNNAYWRSLASNSSGYINFSLWDVSPGGEWLEAVLDTEAPQVNLSISSTHVSTGEPIALSCSAWDDLNPEPETKLLIHQPDGETVPGGLSFTPRIPGIYTVICIATDQGNTNTAQVNFIAEKPREPLLKPGEILVLLGAVAVSIIIMVVLLYVYTLWRGM